jgi:hypothetical protein
MKFGKKELLVGVGAEKGITTTYTYDEVDFKRI